MTENIEKESDNTFKQKRHKKSEFIASIVINLIMLFVVNNLLNWHFPYLTDRFRECLLIINISFVASIIVSIIYLIYSPNWFYYLLQLPLNVISFFFMATLYNVYPFDFSSVQFDLNFWFRSALICGFVGLGIGFIVNLVKLAIGDRIKIGE